MTGFAKTCGCGGNRQGSSFRSLKVATIAMPRWSPDGKYIAFISDRALPGEEEGTERVWLIDPNGGEAFPLYREKEDAHAFAWSHDGSAIYFAITEPFSKDQKEAIKKEWKDVIRWREQERGDVLLKALVATAVAENIATPNAGQKPPSLPHPPLNIREEQLSSHTAIMRSMRSLSIRQAS